MGLIKAFTGAVSGTFGDQWKDIITVGPFGERVAVMPGVMQRSNNGRGSNFHGSEDIITNGSKIYVPENTAAFVFDQSGIEEVITEPGGYEYRNGESSVLNGDGIGKSIFGQVKDRFVFGGQPSDNKRVAFINLRELRGVKFGTPGPLMYNDMFYGTDLEIRARGSISLRVTDPVVFVKQYVPANTTYYSFDDQGARDQILSEFMQSFAVALNSLSGTFRISQLPAQSSAIAKGVADDERNAGTWAERFGFVVSNVGIESIEFTPESRELVKRYSANKMSLSAYENVSRHASNVAAQQKIAQGVENHGLGDAGGMLFGVNMVQGLSPMTAEPAASNGGTAVGTVPGTPVPHPDAQTSGAVGRQTPSAADASPAAVSEPMSFDEQVEALKKLKELQDAGILTQAEFDAKKKQILGL